MSKFFVFLLLAASSLFSYERVILYFDVNKTIIAEDPAGGKTEEQIIQEITQDKATQKVLERKLHGQKGLIFPSFYRLINYLNCHKIPYTIVIRTFGTDLPRIVEEIQHRVPAAKFCLIGSFKKGSFTLNGQQMSLAEMYQAIKRHHFIAIRDDYEEWHEHKKARSHGKRFPIDLHDKETLSLFFDDKISLAAESSIVTPVDIVTGKVIAEDNNLVVVDTKRAILDDSYYMRLFTEHFCSTASEKSQKGAYSKF